MQINMVSVVLLTPLMQPHSMVVPSTFSEIHMRKFLFGLLMACAASVNAADYFSVTMDVDVNGNPVAHSAIVEIGKKIQVTSKSLDNGRPSIRLDYTIDKIGSDDKGGAIAQVSGMVLSMEGDGVWSLANDFMFAVKIGSPASIKTSFPRWVAQPPPACAG